MHKLYRRIFLVILIFISILLLTVGALWLWARPGIPGSFYSPSHELPSEHGVLLRSEPFTNGIPENAKAWKILYTTTYMDHTPTVASAVVIMPKSSANTPHPLVAWAHGTIGIVPGCAPSFVDETFPNGSAGDLLNLALSQGWVIVATDYAGLGTTGTQRFLIGEDEGRSVLDSIKAVQQFKEVSLNGQTVIWGHSQGGHAVLWSGILASFYTPDLAVDGIAALSPASDLPALIQAVKDTVAGKIISAYIISSYSEEYSDVQFNDVVKTGARFLTKDMASRCLTDKKTFFSVAESLMIPENIFAVDPTTGAFGKRLAENIPQKRITVPVLLAQGTTDTLVLPEIQNNYVTKRCAAGQQIDYRVYTGRDHLSILVKDSPLLKDLLLWTKDRFEKNPQKTTCETIER